MTWTPSTSEQIWFPWDSILLATERDYSHATHSLEPKSLYSDPSQKKGYIDFAVQGIETSRTFLLMKNRIHESSGRQWAGSGGSSDADIWMTATEILFILPTVLCSSLPHITEHCEHRVYVIARCINLARPWCSAIGPTTSLAVAGDTFQRWAQHSSQLTLDKADYAS